MVSVLVSSVVDHGFYPTDELMIYHTREMNSNHYPTMKMVSVLVSSVVEREFIGGVMVRRACLECGTSWVHRWGNG
jgi:hypothetical protein